MKNKKAKILAEDSCPQSYSDNNAVASEINGVGIGAPIRFKTPGKKQPIIKTFLSTLGPNYNKPSPSPVQRVSRNTIAPTNDIIEHQNAVDTQMLINEELLHVVRTGTKADIKRVLAQNPQLTYKNSQGHDALHFATERKDKKIIKLINKAMPDDLLSQLSDKMAEPPEPKVDVSYYANKNTNIIEEVKVVLKFPKLLKFSENTKIVVVTKDEDKKLKFKLK